MNLRLSHKIPLAIALSAAVTAGAVSFMSLNTMVDMAEHDISENMKSTLYTKEMALTALMSDITGDLHAIADNPYIISALKDFSSAYGDLEGNAVDYLQKQYITDNPNETGKKHLLDAAGDNSRYSEVHAEYHPYLREFLEENGYYDLFLINKEGTIVYSVFKEADYATNLKHGQWKDTGIARLFDKIMAQADAEEVSYADYAPYAPSNNAPAAFIGRPIEDVKGNYIGALIYQMPIDKFSAIFNDEYGMGKSGRVLLVGEDKLLRNNVRFSTEPTILKTKLDNQEIEWALGEKDGVNFDSRNEAGTQVITAYDNYKFKDTEYALLFQMDKTEVLASVVAAKKKFMLIALANILVVGLLGMIFARTITKVISRMTDAMRKVANSEFETEVPGLSRKDEVGEMAAALQVFKENGQQIAQLAKQQESQQKQMEEQRRNSLHAMANELEQKVKHVVDMVASAATEMDSTSKSVAQMADGSQHKLQSLSDQINSTSQNVQTVAGASAQLSSAISEISGQVARSSDLTHSAVNDAEQADTSATSLTEAAQKISEVVEMINSIAAQINLLALNATIEAARAGEAGKGFAVVASEVKNLASQTTKATEQIGAFISAIQGAASDTVGVIKNISGKIRNINEISTTIAAAVEEQGVATKDISSNVQQAAASTEEVARNASDVTRTAQETGSAATEMTAASSELSRQAEILRKEMDIFLTNVRAA